MPVADLIYNRGERQPAVFYSKSISLKYKNTNRFFITYFQLYSLVVTDISKHVNDIKMHFTVFTVNQRSGVRVKKGCGLRTRQTKRQAWTSLQNLPGG